MVKRISIPSRGLTGHAKRSLELTVFLTTIVGGLRGSDLTISLPLRPSNSKRLSQKKSLTQPKNLGRRDNIMMPPPKLTPKKGTAHIHNLGAEKEDRAMREGFNPLFIIFTNYVRSKGGF
jgi:hypothetical protein